MLRWIEQTPIPKGKKNAKLDKLKDNYRCHGMEKWELATKLLGFVLCAQSKR